jgi:CheY-like chemotaxis protein
LQESKVLNKLHSVEDGVQAMEFLCRQGPYTDAPRPGLILLDLNLPRMSGLEVLRKIKADETLKSIPVIVLSTSKAEEDIVKSYGLYANCYVSKPVNFVEFINMVKSVNEFWFSVVTLPPEQNNGTR